MWNSGNNPQHPNYPNPGSGYPSMSSGYTYPGCPPSDAGFVPPNAGYPPSNIGSGAGYPPANVTYPPSSYPPAGVGYPPSNYPPAGVGYPPTNAPHAPAGYPPNNAGYPPNNAGYPPTGQVYPTAAHEQPYGGQYPFTSMASGYPCTNTSQNVSTGNIGAGFSPWQMQPGNFPPACQGMYSAGPGLPATGPGYPTPNSIQAATPTMSHSGVSIACGDIYRPTLKAFEPFNVESDCEALRKAMRGLGTDEDAITSIIARRSSEQRKKILSSYKSMFGKNLISELDSELSGNFAHLIKALICGLAEFLAKEIHGALAGAGTDENVVIEILCTQSNEQIANLKSAYTTLYKGRDLEKDVVGDTSGDFKRLCIALLQAGRDEKTTVDQTLVQRDVEALYKAGEGKWGTEETKFIHILCSRSYPHLKSVNAEYQRIHHKSIPKVIESETSGSFGAALLTIAKCVVNKQEYFAKKLINSMKGFGTDDNTLIRVVVSRCEIDLAEIKDIVQRESGKPLSNWIKGDTSGDYRTALLALIGN